jgi:hypothetical protein
MISGNPHPDLTVKVYQSIVEAAELARIFSS